MTKRTTPLKVRNLSDSETEASDDEWIVFGGVQVEECDRRRKCDGVLIRDCQDFLNVCVCGTHLSTLDFYPEVS